jgi:hypothetical protein
LGTKREQVTFPSRFSLFEIDPHSFSFLQTPLLAVATFRPQVDAMAGESSASALDLRGASDLLLIQCTECHWAIVLRLVSKKEWSRGDVFYCYPFYKVSGSI